MRVMIALLVAGLLVGCATATEIRGPDGQSAMLIECPGAANTMATCVKKANEVCPDGYTIAGSTEGSSGQMASLGGYGAFSTPVIQRHLVVACE